jgi:predicted NUDIX family NTP pyrophosphohydrolase
MKKSAGILIYKKKNGNIQIFLVHPGGPFWKNKDLNSWSIPKGEIENEEDLKDTAIREFEEETGIVLTNKDKENIFYLGEVKNKNKIVYVFALEKDLGDEVKVKSNLVKTKFGEFPEVDKGQYFNLEEAINKLVSYQKNLIKILKDKLKI